MAAPVEAGAAAAAAGGAAGGAAAGGGGEGGEAGASTGITIMENGKEVAGFTNIYKKGETPFETTFQPIQHNCNRMFLPGINICI